MGKVNYDWVKSQFAEAKIRINVGKAVLKMLKTWDDITDLNAEQSKQVLDILSQIGLGHSLVPIAGEQIWIDARPGQVVVGDIVRVMHDAYDGELGTIHNGRIGTIVAIRSGDIIVNSTDTMTPDLVGVHYQADKLQKRVR
jgi:hypothetical protein